MSHEYDADVRAEGRCGYIGDGRDKPCGLAEGWGYENATSGLCDNHGDRGGQEGNQNAVGNDGGAPEGNQNAQTHGLFASRDGYHNDLDDDEQQWVFDFTNALLDRHREMKGKEPDMFDREALKNIAIDFHKVAHANGYFREEGLVQTNWQGTMEGRVPLGDEVNVWASEIRQHNESVYRRMQKHGLLDDPESQKADALGQLAVEVNRTHVTEENVDEYAGN